MSFTHFAEGVDDLLVGELDASGVSGLIVHVEPEHLPVDQINLSWSSSSSPHQGYDTNKGHIQREGRGGKEGGREAKVAGYVLEKKKSRIRGVCRLECTCGRVTRMPPANKRGE